MLLGLLISWLWIGFVHVHVLGITVQVIVDERIRVRHPNLLRIKLLASIYYIYENAVYVYAFCQWIDMVKEEWHLELKLFAVRFDLPEADMGHGKGTNPSGTADWLPWDPLSYPARSS